MSYIIFIKMLLCLLKQISLPFFFCHISNDFLDNASASVSKLFSFRLDLWFHFK